MLQVFDAETGKRLSRAKFGGNTRIEAAGFSPDGERVAIAAYSPYARIWDLSKGTSKASLKEILPFGHTWSARIHPQGSIILTSGLDGYFYVKEQVLN